MVIETLEARLDELREINNKLIELLKYKQIEDHYNKEVTDLIKIHFPKLEYLSKGLIEMTTTFTVDNGHSDRVDFVKDTAFELYGKCIGEEL